MSSDDQTTTTTLDTAPVKNERVTIEEVGGLMSPSRQPKSGRLSRIRVIRAGRSKNGNNYPTSALAEALPMFDRAPVYYNHRGRHERDFRDLAGEILNPRLVNDGIIAEFEPLESDVWLKSLMATKPHRVQFSVFVEVDCERSDAGYEVKKIVGVESVDIVIRAAAGGEVLEVLESVQDDNESEEPTVSEEKKPDEQVNPLASELATLKEANATLTASVAKLTADNTLLTEQVKGATSALNAMKAEAAKLARENMLEAFIASKKGQLPAASEKLFRRDLCALSEPTAETMEAVFAEVKGLVEGITAEVKPAAQPKVTPSETPKVTPPVETGLPPRAPVTPETKTESAPPAKAIDGRSVFMATIFG